MKTAWFTTRKVFQQGEHQETVGREAAGPKLCPPVALRAVDIHRETERRRERLLGEQTSE